MAKIIKEVSYLYNKKRWKPIGDNKGVKCLRCDDDTMIIVDVNDNVLYVFEATMSQAQAYIEVKVISEK